jgi:hypothetical protein
MLLRFVMSDSACAEDGWLHACKVNPYDGHILEPQPEQVSDTEGRLPRLHWLTDITKGERPLPGWRSVISDAKDFSACFLMNSE